ncbi:MAG: hypothetical protein K8I02_07795 [Candidatus Methylomirabilis sp.]|nr:hypothetical protein [Deltaproteobacteria bacterium]
MAWADRLDHVTEILHVSGDGGSTPPAWSHNTTPSNAMAGSGSGRYDAGTKDDSFLLQVRKSGGFAAARKSAVLSCGFKMNSSNIHYGVYLLRFQPANPAHGPADCDAADFTGGSGYILVVDRFGGLHLKRGPLVLGSAALLWAPNFATFAPVLGATVNGFWLYRVVIFDTPGGDVGFLIYQSTDPAADVDNDAHWTLVQRFKDASAGKITSAGLFGRGFYTGSGTNVPLYIDNSKDRPLEDAA